MGVLYGRYDLLDKLTAYKARPALATRWVGASLSLALTRPAPATSRTCAGALEALEYIEWVGETFGAEHAERYAGEILLNLLRVY